MKLSYYFLWILALCLPAPASAQSLFVTTVANNIFGDAHNVLIKMNPGNCQGSYIDTLPLGVYTIAATANDKLWALSNEDSLGGALYRVDTLNGNLSFAGYFYTEYDYVQSMGALNDSVLLIPCRGKLYGLNTNTVQSFLIGYLGDYYFDDMTWLGQDLYIIASHGNPNHMNLAKVSFNNGSYPPIAGFTIVNNAPFISGCFGLATRVLPNADTLLLGFAGNKVYNINPLNGTYTPYCSLTPDSLGYFTDAAAVQYPSIPLVLDTLNPNSIPEPGQQEAPPFIIYPNPAADVVHLQCKYTGAVLMLTDISGKVLQRYILQKGHNSLSLASYAPGMYMAAVWQDGKIIDRQKLVKE
jgi:hypothetical protein